MSCITLSSKLELRRTLDLRRRTAEVRGFDANPEEGNSAPEDSTVPLPTAPWGHPKELTKNTVGSPGSTFATAQLVAGFDPLRTVVSRAVSSRRWS